MISFSRISFVLFSGCILFFSVKTFAQQNVNYDDVGVIVNMNDTTSQAIASYFQAQRKIPAVNMIPVYTTSKEEIHDSIFRDMALQIQNYIDSNNLTTKLNYLVTTKGCPLKVLRAIGDTDDHRGCSSSVEAELMLLTPANQSQIGSCIPYDSMGFFQFFQNPYFNHITTFLSSFYKIYLVTRLDGYTEEDVFSLIDRSGPNVYASKDSVLFVFDQSPNWVSQSLNSDMGTTATMLTGRGWQVLLNTDSVFVTNQKNVIGYYSWGSNDGFSDYFTQHAIPHNTWADGSIAETGVSTSGRSFQPGTPYGQSLIADLLHEGATGAKGYVYEPITIAIAYPTVLFNLYTSMSGSGVPTYNLAESYFSASRMIGWMDVVVGDPKTSITTNLALSKLYHSNSVKEVETTPLQIFPNPAANMVFLRTKTSGHGTMKLRVFDILGKQVMQEEFPYNGDIIHNINVEHLAAGIYTLQLQGGSDMFSSKISVVR